MCFDRELNSLSVLSIESVFHMSPTAQCQSSPNSDGNNRLSKIMRPRLPRKLTRSAKINLNNYWNVLESFMTSRDQNKPSTKQRVDDGQIDNEINDNISNEKRESLRLSTIGSCQDYLVPQLENFKMDDPSK